MNMSRAGAVLALVASAFTVVTPEAQAATTCTPNGKHCYSTFHRGFSPGATEVWATLRTRCMSIEPGGFFVFDNNEIWAGGPGSGNYVEFGITMNGKSGYPTYHWFYARTNGGSQTGFELNRAYSPGVDANDTIIYEGKTGNWVFKQGGTVFGQTAGDFPLGPIVDAQLGGEIGANSATDQQNSLYDYNAGRIQSNVTYSTWANPAIYVHDVPLCVRLS